jgi:hypothetical protein
MVALALRETHLRTSYMECGLTITGKQPLVTRRGYIMLSLAGENMSL